MSSARPEGLRTFESYGAKIATCAAHHRAHPCTRRHDQGARQATLEPHHAHWSRLHRFPEPLAEDERQRIVKRANDGRVAARKRGVHMGRKPKLTELQRRVARERIAKGESARSVGVAHTTVARAVYSNGA